LLRAGGTINTSKTASLVGGLNPSEKYESQFWMMIPQYIMESHKSHVPKHQPDARSKCRMTIFPHCRMPSRRATSPQIWNSAERHGGKDLLFQTPFHIAAFLGCRKAKIEILVGAGDSMVHIIIHNIKKKGYIYNL
jgi:hypothetical protein